MGDLAVAAHSSQLTWQFPWPLCGMMLRLEGDAWAAPDSSHALLAGFVQFLQYYYQSGCLYRLRALGERHNMDLTVGEWDGPCWWPQPGAQLPGSCGFH